MHEALNILHKHLDGTSIKAWLIGSRARGEQRTMSDIDFALQHPQHPIDRTFIAQLADDFEESEIPYTVDIVDLQEATPNFKTIINKDAIAWIS